jgi:hypothetical protein
MLAQIAIFDLPPAAKARELGRLDSSLSLLVGKEKVTWRSRARVPRTRNADEKKQGMWLVEGESWK